MQVAAPARDPNPGAAVQPDPAPAIGRVVLYTPMQADRDGRGDGEVWPAIITRVWSPAVVNLQVLADAGPAFAVTSVNRDWNLQGLPRTWRWPARV